MAGDRIRTLLEALRSPLHPSGDRLLRALRCHPADPRTWALRCHFIFCRRCRRAAIEIEQNDLRLFVRHEASVLPVLTEHEESRRRLIASLRSEHDVSRSKQAPRASVFLQGTVRHGLTGPGRVHILGAALTAAVLCFLVTLSVVHKNPETPAGDLLRRAVALQPRAVAASAPGVVLQRIQLSASGQAYSLMLYRDRQGRRRPKAPSISPGEQSIARRLAVAGVSVEDPLSVVSYRDWHDHLTAALDTVSRPAPDIVTISTTVRDDGSDPVRAQSISLRGSDLHPLSRSIEFRGDATIEIAELQYQELPWSKADADWFWSDAPPSLPLHAARRPVPVAISAPPLSDEELNIAELNARLLLGREEADVSEQIEVVRGPDGIFVRGVVSSAGRKQHLQSEIAAVAHLRADLETPEEREAAELSHPQAVPTSPAALKMVQAVSGASPLLEYWTRLHRDKAELPGLGSSLLDSGLRARQQARALRDAVRELAAKQVPGTESGETYRKILMDHEDRLRAALAEQSRTLDRIVPGLATDALATKRLPGDPTSSGQTGDQPIDLQPHPGDLLEQADALDRETLLAIDLCRHLSGAADTPGPQNATDATDPRNALAMLTELARQDASIAAALGRLNQTLDRPLAHAQR